MTTTHITSLSPARIGLRRWLAGAVCMLAGLRIGLDAAVLAGLTGGRFDGASVVLQMVAMAVVASIVLRGRRAALGIATICLIYAITAALIQLGPAPTRWTALLLTHHTVLLLSVLGLWAVGIEKPPPNRPRLAVVLGIGVLAGIAAGPLLARLLATT